MQDRVLSAATALMPIEFDDGSYEDSDNKRKKQRSKKVISSHQLEVCMWCISTYNKAQDYLASTGPESSFTAGVSRKAKKKHEKDRGEIS